METSVERAGRDRQGSLKERVLEVLRHEIRTGALGQGVRLVESELTKRLNVSRTPLREALRQLEAEGLVVVEPHKGARVSRKNRDELWEHYRVYAALQGLAAELAAPKLTARDLARIREIEAQLERPDALSQGHTWVTGNLEFHEIFVHRAGSSTIRDLLERQAAYLARFWPLGLHAPGVLEASLAQHRRIVDLCDPPQPGALRDAVEAHFLDTGRLLLEHACAVYAL
jgi:DNA-binding GntR family transcriptional regulator